MVENPALPGVLGFLGNDRRSTTILVLLAILLRVLTGLSSYSGTFTHISSTAPGQADLDVGKGVDIHHARQCSQALGMPPSMGTMRRSGTGWSSPSTCLYRSGEGKEGCFRFDEQHGRKGQGLGVGPGRLVSPCVGCTWGCNCWYPCCTPQSI